MYLKNLRIPVLTLLFLTFIIFMISIKINQDTFVYGLDDPYIHMSMAKHLAKKFILSVDGYHYASASSSPLWTILLSLFYFLPNKLFYYVPLILNIISQIFILILVKQIMLKIFNYNIPNILLILLFLLTPFIPLSFGGMEHSLQILLILSMLYYFLKLLNDDKNLHVKIIMLILAPFVVFIRYENFAYIFMIAVIIVFYLKDYKFAWIFLISSLFFVFLFGMWSIYLGLGFFPNSIMAKSIIGNQFDIVIIKNILENLVRQLSLGIHIDILLLINIYILFKTKDKQLFILSLIFIGTTLIHASFAQFGWFYRYEAYLVILGVMNIFIFLYINQNIKSWRLFLIYFLLIFFFILHLLSPVFTIYATKNIYEQQFQMANFLRKYKNHANIAANDIGAITYFTNVKLLDLVGLGSYEVLKLKKSGNFNNDSVLKLLLNNNIELILVYDHWFPQISFENSYFKKIGEWKINYNLVTGGSTVSFYSRNDVIDLNKQILKEYSEKELPKTVQYKIID